MGGSRKVTIGYKYYMGIHMVFSYGNIDEVQDIIVGDRSLKTNNAGIFPINTSGKYSINSPELFGGEKREGGIQGNLDVLFGEATQGTNAYLDSQIDGSVPAYKGVFSFILNKMYVAAMNPYIKPWGILAKRTLKNHDGSPRWYSSKADVGGQCNAAHIIYEVITNPDWGMRYPVSSIDDANFKAAADQFYTEGFGLWIKWSSSSKIADVIAEVQKTVDCQLYQDASTGKFKLKLIRDDYTPGTVPVFNESNIISVSKFMHKGWGETINEVSVVYTDPTNRGAKTTVTVQDLGNIQMQGQIISKKKDYPALTNATIASRVAARDLAVFTVPLIQLELVVNRSAWNLIIGDVFEFQWVKYGVITSYFRIASIDKGSLTDGTIKINALEDIFSLPKAVYVQPQPPKWEIPNNIPEAVLEQRLYYVGYWDVHQILPQANIDTLDPAFAGVMTNAVAATTDTFEYNIFDTNTGITTGSGDPSAFCRLHSAINNTLQSIEVNSVTLLGLVELDSSTYILIDDEIMKLNSITPVLDSFATLNVNRGALDTVPTSHNVNADVWFPSDFAGFETEDERLDGETVTVKLLPRTTLGTLDPSLATEQSLTLNNRYQAPYPPGYLQINGTYLASSSGSNTITFTWQDRNRQLSIADIICSDEDAPTVPDEDGYTINYFIDMEDANGDRLTDGPDTFPHDLGTAKTYIYDNTSHLHAQLTVKLWSVYNLNGPPATPNPENPDADNIRSWQVLEHTFLTAGGQMHDRGNAISETEPTGDHWYESHL